MLYDWCINIYNTIVFNKTLFINWYGCCQYKIYDYSHDSNIIYHLKAPCYLKYVSDKMFFIYTYYFYLYR